MKRLVGGLVALTILIPAILLGVTLFAVNNPGASAWLIYRAVAFAPGSLIVEDIRGDLVSGLSIRSIGYTLPELRIDATDTRIDIDWLQLVENRLRIEKLTAGRLAVTLLQSEDRPRTGLLPTVKLPIAIDLNDVGMDELRVSTPDRDETLNNVSGRARLQGARIDVLSLNVQRENLAVGLQGHIELTERYPLTAKIDWRLDQTDVSGFGSLDGDLETLVFEHQIGIPDTINLSGTIHSITREPAIDGSATWARIVLPAGGDDTTTLTAGRASLSGDTSKFDLEIRSDLKAASLPLLATSLSATGNSDRLEISRLFIEAFDGQIEGTGDADLGEQRISLRLTGRNLNPGTIVTDMPGRLSANATIHASLPDRIIVDLDSVAGTLIGEELSGHARLTIVDEQVTASGVHIDIGNNRMSFDGDILPWPAGRFVVDANDLAQLSHELRGQIRGTGVIRGSWEKPVADVDFRAASIYFREQGAEQILIQATIEENQTIDAVIRADAVRVGETQIGDVTTKLYGNLGAQIVDFAVSDGPIGIVANATGGWNGKEMHYQLNSAAADIDVTGTWHLRSPFDVRVRDYEVSLAKNCWDQGAAELCIGNSRADRNGLSIDGRLKDFPLAIIQRWAQEGLSISGSADATFRIIRQDEDINGYLNWSQNDTRIKFKDSADTSVETVIDAVQLEIAGSDRSVKVTGRIHSDLDISADVDAVLTDLLSENVGVNGQLRILAPDIGESTALINRYFDVQKLNGRLEADLRVTGTLAAPRISGTGELVAGSASLPLYGIDLEDVRLSLNGRNDSPLRMSASANSGGGTLSIDGILDVAEQTGPFADLRIHGSNFQVLRMPNQTIYVSPDLRSRIDEGHIDIRGMVLVPNADIRIEALPENAATPSSDVIMTSPGKREARRQAPLSLAGDIELLLGDDVHFAGFGVDTRLAGGLKLSRTAENVNTFAEGNLRAIDGQFEAYRKKLNIDRGTVIFAGQLNDPAIDARASRELVYDGQTITVGVLLSGPLSNMRSELFSEPAMNEADALSYLVLNRPINRAEGDDQSDLSAAAISFGLSQALPFTERLQKDLGIDEVSLEGTNTQATAIVAGKRLSEDVSIRYSYGLFNRIGTFIVRYDLTRGFVMEAGSGEEQTLDLIYSIQR